MYRLLIIISSILLFNCEVFSQESRTSFEIFLLSDFSSQVYSENDITNTTPFVDKITLNGFDITYGLGSQFIYYLNSNFTVQFGLGFKYTFLEYWFILPTSSDSRWHHFAEEEATLIHVFTPVSFYFQTLKNSKFRIRPGISIEPNFLIHHKSSLTAYDSDRLSMVHEPEGSPNAFFGLFSVDLKCSYEFKNSSEIFTTFKLHNIPKYFNEDLGITSSNFGLMVNIGYKFKTHAK